MDGDLQLVESIKEVFEARHMDLEKRLDRVEEDIGRDIANIYKKLDQLADRPSWTVVTLITLLSSGFFTLLAVVLVQWR